MLAIRLHSKNPLILFPSPKPTPQPLLLEPQHITVHFIRLLIDNPWMLVKVYYSQQAGFYGKKSGGVINLP